MNKSKKRNSYIIAITILLVLVIFFVFWLIMQKDVSRGKGNTEISAWLVDWQWKAGLKDFLEVPNTFTSIQLFAGYFDESDRLMFTREFDEAMPEIIQSTVDSKLQAVYMTVVNDRFENDGAVIQKDPHLISRLVASKDTRKQHIDEIVSAAEEYGFDGVEIDYENIEKADWNNVCLFYHELYDVLKEQGKMLRIVLESKAPIETLSLPEGPTYSMMAYNLYGAHSGPGPKADKDFLIKLANKMNQLPGKPIIALSVGGFDWNKDDESVSAVTEKEAIERAKNSTAKPKRDPDSGSLYFDYKDNRGSSHTIWYADHKTVSKWIKIVEQEGIEGITIWRLGGISKGTLHSLDKH
ncbi:glycosyl hydrolase family 18 protein [Bacillus sp. 1P06AnD]|uniref:glycosyl hydrolase family 18 protein n=1 Tax=Bacillus sp. 1P06AnD TaxID=3132208 RepID=UPI00399FB56A